MHPSRSISNQQPLKECESDLPESFSRSSFSGQESLAPVQPKWMISLKNSMHLVALQICQGGPDVWQYLPHLLLTSSKEFWSNKRFRVGFIGGLVAIPSWFSHLFFNISTRIDGFYYVNYVFYFNTIRPYMAMFFMVTGFFIAAPQKWKFKWFALPIAVFCLSEIISQSFYTSWQDFYNPMPMWEYSLIMVVSMPALFASADYLLYRKYHLKDGTAARVIGILNLPIDWEQKKIHLENLRKEMENFNARV
jgi:hypothetical protein